MSKNRNELLRRLAVASQSGSLKEQRDLVQALAQLDKEATRRAEEERDLDWANTSIKPLFEPRIAHTMHSEQTDWMSEISTTASPSDYHNKIHAEASMWFNRVDNDVKSDPDEFVEQARGFARRVTGGLGDRAEAAAQEFLSYVGFLYKQSASGLPQVQQEFDSHDQYAPTPVPPEVFPTFEGPVHPLNEWVENGSETDSNRPNRAQDVGGAESRPLPDEGESKDVEGYPHASDAGTGEPSSHDGDDAEDRSDNANWPETTPSGDAAAEGARPSEHSEDDDLTSKESHLVSLSMWDALDYEMHAQSSLEDVNEDTEEGEKDKAEDKDEKGESASDEDGEDGDRDEEEVDKKTASWVSRRLYEKLALLPMDNVGGTAPHPATGTPGPGGGQPGDPGVGTNQNPMLGEPPASPDKPDHETLMQKRKDIAGVDSFPAPNSPINNANTI